MDNDEVIDNLFEVKNRDHLVINIEDEQPKIDLVESKELTGHFLKYDPTLESFEEREDLSSSDGEKIDTGILKRNTCNMQSQKYLNF
jgi:hypothetical protein